MLEGAGRGKRNLVFVSVGTGVGAGIILGGSLFRGATGAAGEVAYFVTDVETLRDNAGGRWVAWSGVSAGRAS